MDRIALAADGSDSNEESGQLDEVDKDDCSLPDEPVLPVIRWAYLLSEDFEARWLFPVESAWARRHGDREERRNERRRVKSYCERTGAARGADEGARDDAEHDSDGIRATGGTTVRLSGRRRRQFQLQQRQPQHQQRCPRHVPRRTALTRSR